MIVKKELTNVKGFTFVQNTTPTMFDVKDTWYNPDTHELKVRTAYGWVPYWEFNSDKAGYSLWVCGRNNNGQLGQNDRIDRSSPVQVGSDNNWSKIISLSGAIIAIKIDNTLWAWGYNGYGQLGLNDVIYRSSPVQIGTDSNWSKIGSTGINSTLAIKTDGTLWTWGRNEHGRLGLNDTVARSSPTQVGLLNNWKDIPNSFYSSGSAIKNDGTLWTWGLNENGILGLNDIINRSSPTQVGLLDNWEKISDGRMGIKACRKTDGTLWVLGGNNSFTGLLGQNDTINRSSPVQVGSDTDWNSFNINNGVYAIKIDGTLWTWGYNSVGNLGLNDIINRSSPVQIGSDNNWNKCFTVHSQGVAIKNDGTLWACGHNDYGQLGQNDRIARSSPVQVGIGNNWNMASGYFFLCALKK